MKLPARSIPQVAIMKVPKHEDEEEELEEEPEDQL
jgi:hypothetical protein